MTRRETRIVNRLGLHARAAAQLVRMANEYNSDISLIKSNQQANAKTIMAVSYTHLTLPTSGEG